MQFSWLPDGSERSVRDALAIVAPEIAEAPLIATGRVDTSDRRWWSSSAVVGGAYVVKFAWSAAAAIRLHREILVLDALAADADAEALRLPPVAFASTSPLLLVTEIVPGAAVTYEMARDLDEHGVEVMSRELASFLAALHATAALQRARDRSVPLGEAAPQGTTSALRERFPRVVTGHRRSTVLEWCDWVDDVLRVPVDEVLVHGDLHVHNLLWDRDSLTLRAVIDFEMAAEADAAYDFRYMPRELDLFVATTREYERRTRRPVDIDRVMAWHVLTSLGDALWRAEANAPMPAGGATPDEWFDLVADRLDRLTAVH